MITKDTRKNIKIPPALHEKILHVVRLTGLTIVSYLDVMASDDLARLEAMPKGKPTKVK